MIQICLVGNSKASEVTNNGISQSLETKPFPVSHLHWGCKVAKYPEWHETPNLTTQAAMVVPKEYIEH